MIIIVQHQFKSVTLSRRPYSRLLSSYLYFYSDLKLKNVNCEFEKIKNKSTECPKIKILPSTVRWVIIVVET